MKTKKTNARLSLVAIFVFSVCAICQETSNLAKPESKYFDAKNLLADIEFLSSDALKGRKVGSSGSDAAREHIVASFKKSGVKPIAESYLNEFSIISKKGPDLRGTNIFGIIEGKTNPEKHIVVTAHYDHLGVSAEKIYNGADDNASGTAALLAIAEYFSKNRPENSIIFGAFDAEEEGLRGAKYFVEHLPVKSKNILLDVNMDMISRNDKGELYVAGTYHYPQFKPFIDSIRTKAPVKLLFGHDDPKLGIDDWTFQSDHGEFHRKKIPFLYFGVEDHKDYHQPTDDFANIQPQFFVNAVETVLMAISEIDKNFK